MSKIAFLFPGQGAQTVGMGRQMYDQVPAARKLFDQANEILGYDLTKLCFEGPSEDLDSTVHSQPALFVSGLAAVESIRNDLPEVVLGCEATAGLSLGEYTAMVFADVMDFGDALRVVQQRAEAMQEASDATPSGMVSVLGLERGQVDQLCHDVRQEGETLQVANLLCPGNIVVSGTNEACERLPEVAIAAGAIKVVPLAVAGAFHTPLMESAVRKLAVALKGVSFSTPTIPVISNVDAKVHQEAEQIRDLLIKQLVQPVLWEDSMRYLLDQGFDTFYEVGPGRVLRGLLRRIDRKVSCQSVLG